EQEQRLLLPHLTNNESYFFRESPQLEALQKEVLPALKQALEPTPRREIRLLSAGCASGEEAYTLAMVTTGQGAVIKPWTVRITGVDVDLEALARARSAEYG